MNWCGKASRSQLSNRSPLWRRNTGASIAQTHQAVVTAIRTRFTELEGRALARLSLMLPRANDTDNFAAPTTAQRLPRKPATTKALTQPTLASGGKFHTDVNEQRAAEIIAVAGATFAAVDRVVDTISDVLPANAAPWRDFIREAGLQQASTFRRTSP